MAETSHRWEGMLIALPRNIDSLHLPDVVDVAGVEGTDTMRRIGEHWVHRDANSQVAAQVDSADPTLTNVSLYRQRLRGPTPGEYEVLRRSVWSGAAVLDVGCGDGRITKALLERGAHVVGCDLDMSALIRSARSMSPRNFGRLVQGDARHLPFKDHVFDFVVFAFNGIDFIVPSSGRVRALQDIQRVLRPGAYFVLSSRNVLGGMLSPRGMRSRKEWGWRLRYIGSRPWRHRYGPGKREGYILHRALPVQIIREVEDATGMSVVEVRPSRTRLNAPLWLVSLFSKWPQFVFRKGRARLN
jgi:SAM-dependent methyltransferase